MIRYILILIIICFLVVKCRINDTNIEFGNIPIQLIDSFSKIDSSKTIKIIKTDLTNTIIGKKGTIVIIPSYALTNDNGTLIADSVIIMLKENFTISDFILSNLQTVQGDKILVSQGMIYLNATDLDGNNLRIADNHSIRIQIPQNDLNDSSLIFIGERNKNGFISWNKTIEQAKTLVPYPIRFISKNRNWTECYDYYGITKDTIKKKGFNYYGNIEDFENSLLATKEFKDRFDIICWDSILNIYINNLDKNLWEIDELAIKYLIRDSDRYLNSWFCKPPESVNGRPVQKFQIEAYNSLIKDAQEQHHYFIETFRNFAKQKLTKIDKSKLIDTSMITELNSTFISFDIQEFGWVNVDYFYNDPKAEKVKLIAKTNEEIAEISLIIKGKNIILSGFEVNNNEYCFTKDKEGYNKLPKGDKAILIAIGLKNNKIIFGEKEFVIGDSEIQNIEMNQINGEDLKKKIKNYGS